jgi:hypothetical protein
LTADETLGWFDQYAKRMKHTSGQLKQWLLFRARHRLISGVLSEQLRSIEICDVQASALAAWSDGLDYEQKIHDGLHDCLKIIQDLNEGTQSTMDRSSAILEHLGEELGPRDKKRVKSALLELRANSVSFKNTVSRLLHTVTLADKEALRCLETFV